MKACGIICEYDPLHNGHAYHIGKSKELCGADKVICVMSGCFTQRGAPACCDKYRRTEMALLAGCDIVIELPARYATSSSEGFAASAVNLLASTGMVEDICFGVESVVPDIFDKISYILANEPAGYSKALKDGLKSGMPYPMAMQAALSSCIDADGFSFTPNNILAIGYVYACRKARITPRMVRRTDSGYALDTLSSREKGVCSSLAIRKYMAEHNDWNRLRAYMPASSYALLPGNPITADDFSGLLYSQLLNNKNALFEYLDVSGDIANRIKNKLAEYAGFESFARDIKSRQITYTRVMRALTHVMLGIKDSDMPPAPSVNEKYPIPYIRVLGFKKGSEKLMKLLSENASVPVITRPAAAKGLTAYGRMLFEEDIRAADLYRYALAEKSHGASPLKNEYVHGLVIV